MKPFEASFSPRNPLKDMTIKKTFSYSYINKSALKARLTIKKTVKALIITEKLQKLFKECFRKVLEDPRAMEEL